MVFIYYWCFFYYIPFGMVESFLIGSRSGLKIQINYEMDFLMLYAHKLVKYYYVGSRSKETSRVLPFLFIQICGNVFRLMHSHRIYTSSKREERGCVIIDQDTSSMVVLLYPDISNFTFWNVKILKCKNFLINFLDELGNFKQKKFYTSKCKNFLHFKATDPLAPNLNCKYIYV